MIIFLLSLLILGCSGSDNFLVFKNKCDVLYFLQDPAECEMQQLLNRRMKKVDKYAIPVGQYSLTCNNGKKITGRRCIDSYCANFVLKDKQIAVKLDNFTSYKDNLFLILNNKNFQDNGQGCIVFLSSRAKKKIDLESFFEELLTLYFDKKYVKISMSDEILFNESDWIDVTNLFDEGLELFVLDSLLKDAGKDNIYDVPIQNFLSRVQKYDHSDFAWYEKILALFDNQYSYAKGFFKDDAPFLTVRHSQAFRKSFVRFVVAPLIAAIITIFAFKKYKVL